MEESKSLNPHLDKVYSIYMDMKILKIDDEDLLIYMMDLLSSSYKTFQEYIVYGIHNLSGDNLKKALIQKDEIDAQLSQQTQILNKGFLLSHCKRKGKSRSLRKNLNKVCNHCKLKSLIKHYWTWKKKHSNQEGDQKVSRIAGYIHDSYEKGVQSTSCKL